MSEREILFRGKIIELCKYQGQWLEGFFGSDNGKTFIAIQNENGLNGYFCDSKTVGQYTGLTDKNGTRIFEGDIVKITGFHTTAIAAVKYGSPSEKSTSWGWYFDDNHGHTYHLESQAFCRDYNAIIIGNIHDNPELM